MAKATKGFPPVVDAGIETLILGSFPSVASLGKAQYYGHPQNHFWRLVGAVIGEPLPDMDYEERKRALLRHRIGLWDIIGACARKGSLDSNIRDPRHNDFSRVTSVAKKLRRICFNGKTAGRMEPPFIEWGFETIVLPSSSPANTLRFELKLAQWRQISVPAHVLSSRQSPITNHQSRTSC
ncbi:MAG: DNA-deoxyinosine glycosylase [Betaproteobacteria bacterium]|nr:DNA-deoxyinosine glycosylase [Betaproteobacteria bacterium]